MIKYIWLLFSIIFLSLAIFRFIISKKKIESFEFEGRIGEINGVKLGMKEFAESFNKYLVQHNSNNRKVNIAAAIGYLIASLTAIISFILSPNL